MEGVRSWNEGSVVHPPIQPVSVYPNLAGLRFFGPDEALMPSAQPEGPSQFTKGINVGL